METLILYVVIPGKINFLQSGKSCKIPIFVITLRIENLKTD